MCCVEDRPKLDLRRLVLNVAMCLVIVVIVATVCGSLDVNPIWAVEGLP